MKIIKKRLSELKASEYNPRISINDNKDFYKKLDASIQKFGYVQPIIWNKRTDNIVGGNQRLQILRDTNVQEIDVVEVDLSLEDEKALNITLNKVSSDWDLHKLNEIMEELEGLSYDLDITGFDAKELNELFDQFNIPKEEEFDIDKATLQESRYSVQRGDLFQLGSHVLMCGDSTDSGDVKRLVGSNKADMILIDPPYGVAYSDKNVYLNAIGHPNRIETPIKSDDNTDIASNVLDKALKNIYKVSKAGAVLYCHTPQGGDQMMMMMMMMIKNNFNPRMHQLIWVKNNHVLGRTDYAYKHEPIIYTWKKDGTHKYYGGFQTSILEVDKPLKSELHPTMKPVDLEKQFIKNSSLKEQIILDTFGGSGSTLIACEQTNRVCYMMEIDPHYCSVIIERWESYTGQKHKNIVF